MYHTPRGATRVKIQLLGLTMISLLMQKIYDSKSINAMEVLKRSKLPTERIDNLNNNPDFKRTFSGTGRSLKLTWIGEKEAKELLKNYLRE